MSGDTDLTLIERGRDAMQRHAWAEAYEALSTADRDGSLNGEGLALLGAAAYWTARPDETVGIYERSFGAYMKEGDHRSASMAAFRVGEQYGMRMALSQAQGWAARAVHLAEGNPEWPVHGWLMWMHGLLAWFQGDFEAAVGHYDRALQFADRIGERDLYGMSLHDKGHALCILGRVAEGMPLLDEAMVAVVAGELRPEPAGYVYCGMIGICSKLGDYRRASEWTEATLRWCERESVPAFPGVCRIHKAERCGSPARSRRPRKRPVWPARSSPGSTSTPDSARPTTRSGRCGGIWATSGARRRRSDWPTSTDFSRSPACRSCDWRRESWTPRPPGCTRRSRSPRGTTVCGPGSSPRRSRWRWPQASSRWRRRQRTSSIRSSVNSRPRPSARWPPACAA